MRLLIVGECHECENIARLSGDLADCTCAHGGKEALEAIKSTNFDMAITHIELSTGNGFWLCSEIRRTDQWMPIIVLSESPDMASERVAFSFGCDDYIVKPFSEEDMRLRIAAGLRRAALRPRDTAGARGKAIVRIDDLDILLKENRVILRGSPVQLTPREFQIMALLANNRGKTISAHMIAQKVWGNLAPEPTDIAVFVRRIRTKIEEDPAQPHYLQTIWRKGYRLGDESKERQEKATAFPCRSYA